MTLKKIEKQINGIKQKLQNIGEMRPGSLSRQYNVCGIVNCRCKDPTTPKKHGPYYQLSYVRQGKSTTRFVRKQEVRTVKVQLANYKRFRKLMEDWISLALESAEIKTAQARLAAKK